MKGYLYFIDFVGHFIGSEKLVKKVKNDLHK